MGEMVGGMGREQGLKVAGVRAWLYGSRGLVVYD